MSWTLRDSETGQQVSFSPVSGDIVTTVEQPTAVAYPLRKQDPIVLAGLPRYPSVQTPEWIVTGNADWVVMEQILRSGHRLVIVTDYGVSYPCRASEGYSVRVEDTPDRSRNPRRYVSVKLIGVQ